VHGQNLPCVWPARSRKKKQKKEVRGALLLNGEEEEKETSKRDNERAKGAERAQSRRGKKTCESAIRKWRLGGSEIDRAEGRSDIPSTHHTEDKEGEKITGI